MERFKHILVGVADPEGDRPTVTRAANLAQHNQARLTLISVMPEHPEGASWLVVRRTAVEFQKHLIEERRAQLEQLAARARRKGIPVDVIIETGTPYLAIIRSVLRDGYDLVCTTARREPGLREMLFGSTNLNLIRQCPVPVWVLKPTRRRRLARIMAGVDPSTDDETRNALDRQVLELALSLAELEQAELHIVHAWKLYGEVMLSGGPISTPDPEVVRALELTRTEHQARLDQLLARYPLAERKHTVHLVKGLPWHVIPALVRSERIDVLVMGTIARTGIAGFLIGNTAERILHRVDCSVLTVKPEGFVSPVQLP